MRHNAVLAFPTMTVDGQLVPLSGGAWDLIRPIVERRSRNGGRPAADGRRSLDGMRWVGLTRSPWCDMPAEYGNWETVKRHYARLNERGIITELLKRFPPKPALPVTDPHDEVYKKKLIKALAGQQLECLQHLLTRRRRGRAARAAEREIS